MSPFRATPLASLRELCEAMSAQQLLQGEWTDQVVYDLGCGDGIVNVELASLYGTRGVGLDLDDALVSKANALAAQQKVSHLAEFRVQDIFSADLSEATILFMYLLPDALEKLKPVFEQALAFRPGLLLVVEQWALLNWEDSIVYNHKNGSFTVYASNRANLR